MNEDYWEGGTWIFSAKITNDGSNSGTHEYDCTLAAGDEMEVLYGSIHNLDSSTRTALGLVEDTDDNEIGIFLTSNAISAGFSNSFPQVHAPGDSRSFAAKRFILSGTMNLHMQLASVAVSQDSRFAVVCRLRGDPPTVTLTSPTNATELIETNQVL